MKKVLIIILSIIFTLALGLGITWCVVNRDNLREVINGTAIYTQEDLDNASNDAYNQALQDKDEYENLITEYSNIITQNNDKIIQLNTDIENLITSNNNYQDEIIRLNGVVESNVIVISSLEESVSNNELTIISLNEQIDILSEDIELLESQLSQSNSENESLQLQINSKNSQISDLQELVNQLNDTIETNQSTIASLNNQNSLLSAKVENLQLQLQENNLTISDLNTTITNLQESVDYYENYILQLENQILAIFEFNGSVYGIKVVDESNKVSIEDPVSTEYVIFNYWTVDGVQVDLATYEITKNTKFIANVTYKYKVNFINDDVICETQIVEKDNYVTTPTEPTKESYDFLGWSIDEINPIDLSTFKITSDTNFIALFESKYGLFNPDTGALIYSWNELIDYGYITVDNSVLGAGVNVKRLSGDLKISSDITIVESLAFEGCVAITCVDFGEGVVTIEDKAFLGCTSIECITFYPNTINFGINIFHSDAYGYAGNIKNIYYNGTIEDWCKINFEYAYQNPMYYASYNNHVAELYLNGEPLPETIILPNSITTINPFIFESFDCNFILSNNLTTIGKGAFRNSKINEIIIPNSVQIIDDSAFSYCYDLTTIYVPSSVQTMGYKVFNGCTNLTIYYENNDVPETWSTTWNYTTNDVVLPVKYGYTYEQYLNEINSNN